MKDGKLKGEDFFDLKKDPLITFVSKEDCTDRPQ
jgi:polyisoprenoid-binding protein YceI